MKKMVCLITYIDFLSIQPLMRPLFQVNKVVGLRLLFSRWRKNWCTRKSKFLKIKKTYFDGLRYHTLLNKVEIL